MDSISEIQMGDETTTKTDSTLHYVENETDEWVAVTDFRPAHPAWGGEVLLGAPAYRDEESYEEGGARPEHHELRPGERYYWIEGELPSPPPLDDPVWLPIKSFLQHPVGEWSDDPRLATFRSDIWKDRDGEEEFVSAGGYAQEFGNAPGAPFWAKNTPEFRRVGWEPSWQGHPAGNSYCSATWALENYILTQDPMAWQLFVLRTLHLAGQGFDYTHSNIRGDRSAWSFVADHLPDGISTWHNVWPEAVMFFHFLTGLLSDCTRSIAINAVHNPPEVSASPRELGWYLRTLRGGILLTGGLQEIKDSGMTLLDRVMTRLEKKGCDYFPTGDKSLIDCRVQDDWLFLSEAVHFAVQAGEFSFYERLAPIAQYHLEHHYSDSGAVAYRVRDDSRKRFGCFSNTSYALPFLAIMAAMGDTHREDVTKSTDYVISHLPYSDESGRGLKWWPEDTFSSPTKIAAQAMYGLRPGVVNYALPAKE